ncbi:putative short-chain dehydrogenases/reductase [Lophiostoma macrostomum CBS 122681]|uniref:Putative short-chain dehydrogenases/reductase n=1 Tax=Lophiostoma macrostomum CBS 122681 TaxID=1314788 RepID=A0A6A6T8P7_9PLEO|nr:putative short-chain dehydrogenases/reductase [Lophiostoma macrostomum CBS 122681]
MVALEDVISSNERIAETFPNGLVAVFVGGTSGVGEYTVKAFASYVRNPRVYIIGRSQEAADRIIAKCLRFSPSGSFTFIKADISLLKQVDDVCRQIKSKEKSINVLFMSQGSMAFSKTTSEGLPLTAALAIHSRTRFILNLLPLIRASTSLRRVVSVLAASLEGPIDLDNIPALGFDLRKQRDQMASIQTLLLEEAGRRAPDVSFVHDVPGVVKGGIMREMEPNFRLRIIVAVAGLLGRWIETSSEECGERHVFFATSARYAPPQVDEMVKGVPIKAEVEMARGSDGTLGGGVYTVDQKGESSGPKVESLLDQFRKDGTKEKVWKYVVGDFTKITGAEIAE